MIVVKKRSPVYLPGSNSGPNQYDDAVLNPNDNQVHFDNNLEIDQIHIAYGWYIDSIQIYYRDKRDGSIVPGDKHGGNGGRIQDLGPCAPDPIFLGPGEHVTEIDITYGSWVNTLTIRTNKPNMCGPNGGIYGPYGGIGGPPGPYQAFLVVENPNQQIVGFFGTCGDFIDGIGIDYIP